MGDCFANGQILSSSTYSHVNPCYDQQYRLVLTRNASWSFETKSLLLAQLYLSVV